MSDQQSSSEPLGEPAASAVTAGALLRQARLAKGLHIAALATAIKVAPRKLELLEADRFDELPGATFTRALAQTICRTLKIDPAPVLALLPLPAEQGLMHVSLGLNAPFRDRPGQRVPSDLQFLKSPAVLAALALIVAAAVVYFLPSGWINEVAQRGGTVSEMVPHAEAPASVPVAASAPLSAPEPIASAASQPSAPASAVVGLAATPEVPQAVPQAAAAAPGLLLLRTSAESWVEVVDRRGVVLMSRKLMPAETVGLDGRSPLYLTIGNATATHVTFKGKPVELTPSRDNVAKLELK